jgi:hypothetical protein
MKTRIFGTIFVLTVLVALYILTGGNTMSSSSPAAFEEPAFSSSDNDFKDLKIN